MAGLPFAMRGRWHRVVTGRMVVVALLVGVVLAVGSVPVAAFVAWRVATTTHMMRVDLDVWISTPQSMIAIQRTDLPGGRRWVSTAFEPLPEGVDPQQSPMEWIEPSEDPRPAWSRPGYPGYTRSFEYFASGWPLRAGEGRRVNEEGPTPIERLEWLVAVDLSPEWFAWVPLRPIWPGLLANTLFYAVLALTPMVLLRWRRTRRRRARGLCVACGYELGEGVGVCPECGLEALQPSRAPRVSEGA